MSSHQMKVTSIDSVPQEGAWSWGEQIMEHMEMQGHRRKGSMGAEMDTVATLLRVFKAVGAESQVGRLL